MMYCKNNYDKPTIISSGINCGANKAVSTTISFTLMVFSNEFVALKIAPHTVNMIIRAAGFPGA